jgi:Ca2+-binding RTX toxin-like protein
MTTYAYMTTFTTAGISINLSTGDNLFVGEAANIASTTSTAVYGPGASSVSVAGNLFGDYVGIWFYGSGQNNILVAEDASVTSVSYGIFDSGNNSVVTNAGTVSGYYALGMGGLSPDVHNHGLIQGHDGVTFTSTTGVNLLTNDGTIDALAAVIGNAASEYVYNTGLISGTVMLNAGADIFDSRGGTMQGTVYLGAGDDTAYGGLGADSIDGGDGLDRLRGKQGEDRLDGGLGKDMMTGGADEDEFYFSTTLGGDNVDKITDFVHKEDTILLNSTIFSALGSSVGKSEFLATSHGHSATKASHHLIYDESKGTLWYDADGKGGTGAVKFAQLGTSDDHPTNLNYHDFAIV